MKFRPFTHLTNHWTADKLNAFGGKKCIMYMVEISSYGLMPVLRKNFKYPRPKKVITVEVSI